MPHSFICLHTPVLQFPLPVCTSPTCLFSNLFICLGLHLSTIFLPTYSTFIHCPSHLCSHLVLQSLPPLLSHMLSLALTHSHLLLITPLFPVTHCLSLSPSLPSLTVSITHFTSRPSLPFINPLDDTVPHLASLFIPMTLSGYDCRAPLCIDCLHPFQ